MDNRHEQLFERSKKVTPGGVHSPVRGFKGLSLAPRFIKDAQGAFINDVENKDYIDFCMSFGPLILGHRNEQVEAALHQAIERGWTYGAAESYSLELAEFITEKISFIEQIRFVNSGTEAVMTALRLARGITGRPKIIKFDGCYHGHVDSMLIKAGSGLAGTATASSAGVPVGVSQDTLILELGDLAALEDCFERHSQEIAAVIVEPLPANNGLLIQPEEFLHGLRSLTQKYGALLIFDEVISGFRVGMGGMAEKLAITPDLVTYGKVIGGGLPVGAIAGSKKFMEGLAPTGDVYQAGTLSANPLAMAAGIATLKQLTPKVYKDIAATTLNVVELFNHWLKSHTNSEIQKLKISHYASLFWIHPGKSEITKLSDITQDLSLAFNDLFPELLSKGIYLAPSPYEVGFVSLAHQDILDELEIRLKN